MSEVPLYPQPPHALTFACNATPPPIFHLLSSVQRDAKRVTPAARRSPRIICTVRPILEILAAIRKDTGFCCGSRLRKGEVFAYVGLSQNLKDLKVTPCASLECSGRTENSSSCSHLARQSAFHKTALLPEKGRRWSSNQ